MSKACYPPCVTEIRMGNTASPFPAFQTGYHLLNIFSGVLPYNFLCININLINNTVVLPTCNCHNADCIYIFL